MRVHHIGYLVKQIDKSVSAFEALGYTLKSSPVWDNGRKAYICFLDNGGYCVELIAPSRESSLYPLLKQYQNSPYHMCYCCADLEETIEKLKKDKFMLFLEPASAPAIAGGGTARVAFLMSARAGIIELLEDWKNGDYIF